MAVRIKSKWHRSKRSRKNIEGSRQPKTLEDLASVIAFNLWKVAQEIYRNMGKEDFTFANDKSVMCTITESIAFLAQVVDRTVYGKIEEDKRAGFINTLARQLGDTMQTNMSELYGESDYIKPFFDTLNNRFSDYAECTYSDDEDGGGYAFRRLLGENIAECMKEGDNRWVVEHVMDVEAPKAAKTIKRLTIEVLGLRNQ